MRVLFDNNDNNNNSTTIVAVEVAAAAAATVAAAAAVSRNLSGKLQNRSKKFVPGIQAANTKSKSVEVHNHGGVSQNENSCLRSNFRSTRSYPIVPIDI